MQTISKIGCLLAILLIVSCKNSNNEMTTVILPDGSCYRELTQSCSTNFINGDSLTKNNPFPVDIDRNSIISWKTENSDWITTFPASKTIVDSVLDQNKTANANKSAENTFTVRLRLNYTSVKDMAERFRLSKSNEWNDLKIGYHFSKSFRWFYTYYAYSETYPKIGNGWKVPINKYLDKNEALYWFTGSPDATQGMNGVEANEYLSSLENKFTNWFKHNFWNDEYDFISANYKLIRQPPVNQEMFMQLRDSIFRSKVMNQKEESDMNVVLDKFFRTNSFSAFYQNEKALLDNYRKTSSLNKVVSYFARDFNYKLVMPGRVIDTNSKVHYGDTLSWHIDAYRMIPDQYTITAESRKANIWAFVVTGILLALAIGSFFIRKK